MRAAVFLGSLVISLAGCASQGITIRSVPSEDPAAENAAAVESAAAYAAAAATAVETAGESGQSKPGTEAMPPLTPADAPSMYTYDPWERLNRFTYRFNARFDEAVFLPAANAYRGIPSPIRSGVHNFFGNLSELDNILNYALQWRLKRRHRLSRRLRGVVRNRYRTSLPRQPVVGTRRRQCS
jgi:hypothetical protein